MPKKTAEEKADYQKAYRKRNKKKLAKKAKIRYQNRKEEVQAYYTENKTEIRAKQKKYNKAHKEEKAEYDRLYLEEHREKRNAQKKAWTLKNKQKNLDRDDEDYEDDDKDYEETRTREIVAKKTAYFEAHQKEQAKQTRPKTQKREAEEVGNELSDLEPRQKRQRRNHTPVLPSQTDTQVQTVQATDANIYRNPIASQNLIFSKKQSTPTAELKEKQSSNATSLITPLEDIYNLDPFGDDFSSHFTM